MLNSHFLTGFALELEKVAARRGVKEIRKLVLGPKPKRKRLGSSEAKKLRESEYQRLAEKNKDLKASERKSENVLRLEAARNARRRMGAGARSTYTPSESALERANRIATSEKLVKGRPESKAISRARQIARERGDVKGEAFQRFAYGKKLKGGGRADRHGAHARLRTVDEKGRGRHGALRGSGMTHDPDDIGQAVWERNLGTTLKPLGAKGGTPGNESIADLVAHPQFGIKARKIRYDNAAITRATADRSVRTKNELADLGLATRSHSYPGHKGKTIVHQRSGHTVRYEDPVFGREAGEWAAKRPGEKKKIMDEQKRVHDAVKAYAEKTKKEVADTHGGNILYPRGKGGDYKGRGKVIDILEPPRGERELAREAARLEKMKHKKPADRMKYLKEEVYRPGPDKQGKIGDRIAELEEYLEPKKGR